MKIKKIENTEIEKKKIIDAAYTCFLKKGYAATSVEDIVKEYGKSKGNIYYYYKSKEEICLELWKDWHYRNLSLASELSSNCKNFHEYMINFLEGFYCFLEKNHENFLIKFEFATMSVRDVKYQNLIKEWLQKWYDVFNVFKNQFITHSAFENFFKILFCMIDGLIFRYVTVKNFKLTASLKKEFSKIITLLIKENVKKEFFIENISKKIRFSKKELLNNLLISCK